MDALVEILVLLVAARAFGEAMKRLGQPPAVGELLAGVAIVALAAAVGTEVPLLQRIVASDTITFIANFGIFILVLYAGVELEPAEIAGHSGRSIAVALGGMTVPLAAGFALAWVFLPESPLKPTQAFLVGVAVSITAIPETVKVLEDFDLLHAPVGETIVAAALIDDVLGLFLLGVLTAIIETGGVPEPGAFALMLVKVAAFFGVTALLGIHVYPRVSRRLEAMQAAAVELSWLMAVALAYGLLAEALGMHWVLGAFVAGLYFEPQRVGRGPYRNMTLIVGALSSGLLGPIFFAWIGLRVELGAIVGAPLFVVLITVVAFAGKFVGAGLPAWWMGLGRRDAAAVGAGMSARGAIELIILNIAYAAGLFDAAGANGGIADHLFSALVIMSVVTTLATPIVLRLLLSARGR